MQPTIKELEEKYNKMRDDQILSLLEDEEGMRLEALEILKIIAKKRGIKSSEKVEKSKKKITKETKRYGFSGKIGRKDFLISFIKWNAIGIFPFFLYTIISLINTLRNDDLAILTLSKNILVFITMFLLPYSVYRIAIICYKRLNDISINGWYTGLMFFPYLNLLFFIFLIIKKGNTQDK